MDRQGGKTHIPLERVVACVVARIKSAEGVHAIGLARSDDMGRTWTKEHVPGKKEAGGPVFEARRGNEMAWDNRVVGTPWVSKVPDTDTYRLYYIGTGFGEGGAPTTGIGCAESVGGGLTQWVRVGAK